MSNTNSCRCRKTETPCHCAHATPKTGCCCGPTCACGPSCPCPTGCGCSTGK